jgi:hypothetical protein
LEEVAGWLEVPVETLVVPAVARVNRSMTPSELLLVQHLERYIPGPIPSHIARDLCIYLPNIETSKTLPSLAVQESMWARLLPVMEYINARIPTEQGYQCDICPPEPEIENVVFNKEQIDRIAKSVGEALETNNISNKISKAIKLIFNPVRLLKVVRFRLFSSRQGGGARK